MLSGEFNFIGVDYGSRMAGTTAVAFHEEGQLHLRQSGKKEDADSWLKKLIAELDPELVCIDAPLSLPDALTGQGSNYFYRESDRLCRAMSPMFLGGLTARAIKLSHDCASRRFLEVYPAGLVREMGHLKENYTKKSVLSDVAVEDLRALLPVGLNSAPVNWHQYDAVLCWLSGYRYNSGKAKEYGNPREGTIVV